MPRLGPRIHCFGHNHVGKYAEMTHALTDVLTYTGYGMRIVDWSFNEEEKTGPGQYGTASWNMSNLTMIAPENPYPKAVNMDEFGLGWFGTGLSTLFVNACIMDMHNKPTNAPWVLEMDLPYGKEEGNEREQLATLRN